MLSDDSTYSITSQVLTNATTATYTHTLKVTGKLVAVVGVYQCNVSNVRTHSGSTRSLTEFSMVMSVCKVGGVTLVL